ncbi:MAG: UbiD family decarboxylase [Deltaproteobacteria bacterium]|nr:UbiD family decarboxylase [Deltaproteobacteria bacterium]
MAKDMRIWIERLQQAGELRHVHRVVDPRTEMGALLWQSKERALMLDNIAGHPGWKTLGQGVANWRHAALAFDTTPDRLVATYAMRMRERVQPVRVAHGPVKDIALRGEKIDLLSFPLHLNCTRDGGPYITSGLCVTRDPDSGARNMAMYRLMVHDARHTGFMAAPNHHATQHRLRYEERGEPMPIAVIVGHHPAYYFAAATTVAYGDDEMALAGALLGEPVPLVACETVPLEVPADAEIVIEGYVLPGERRPEGPFSEFQDYYAGEVGPQPVLRVEAITMRRDRIYKSLQNGVHVEGNVYQEVPCSAQMYQTLTGAGGRLDIKNVVMRGANFGVVIQMTPRFPGEAMNVLASAIGGDPTHAKILIAVDEDIDPNDPMDVWWAVETRVNPADDVVIIPGVYVNHLDVSGRQIDVPGQATRPRIGSKMLIDATKPPTCFSAERASFERSRPMGFGGVRLEDFLEEK